jgi:hypothetical protein
MAVVVFRHGTTSRRNPAMALAAAFAASAWD